MPQNRTGTLRIAMLDWANNVGSPVRPPGLKLRLMSVNGSYAAAGTEITAGGGYAAGGTAIVFDAAVEAAALVTAVNQPVSWTNMPAATIRGVEIWDTSGTPRRLWWAPLATDVTVALGNTFSFPAGVIRQELN
jgi:hypothetical protein